MTSPTDQLRPVITIFVLLGWGSSSPAVGGPPTVTEDGRVEGTPNFPEYGQTLVVHGRRMMAGGSTGDVYRYLQNGTWGVALTTSARENALDASQGVRISTSSGSVVDWADDESAPDSSSAIATPAGGTAAALGGATLILGDEGAGTVRAYRRNGDSWDQEFEHDDPDFLSDLGAAVDLDGSRLVYSEPRQTFGGTGEVWTRFRNGNGEWIDFLSVTAPGEQLDNGFGLSVAVSGNWLAVGTPFEDTSFPQTAGIDVGAVHLFKTNQFGFFGHQATLFGSQDDQRFGMDVELVDGTLVIGAPGEDLGRGAAYVYWLVDDLWEFQARLAASDGSFNDALGTAVEIAEPFVFATAPFSDAAGTDYGTIYTYEGLIAPFFADGFESGDTSAW